MSVISAYANYKAAQEQAAQAGQASEAQQDFLYTQMANMDQAAQQAKDIYGLQASNAYGTLQDQYAAGMQDVNAGYNSAISQLGGSAQQNTQTINQGYDNAMGSLGQANATAQGQIGGALDSGLQSLQSGVAGAQQTMAPTLGLQGQGTALADMLQNPYGNFTADPGYQFRLQQGQDAIMNRASAMGGRGGGDTMKALMEHGQNFASNEFNNYAARQQDTMGRMMGLAGMGAGAAGQLAGMQYGAGNTAAGMQMGAGSAQAGMSNAYGQNMADMYGAQTGALTQNENFYGSQLANAMIGQGQAMGGMNVDMGNALANVNQWMASGQAGALMSGATGQNSLSSQMVPTFASQVPYAGAGWQAAGQAGSDATQLALMAYLMSDERAKTSVERGSIVHDRVEEFLGELRPVAFQYRDTQHGEGRHHGIMVQDVERSEIGRDMVVETRDGKALDTQKLLSAVLAALGNINARLEALEAAR